MAAPEVHGHEFPDHVHVEYPKVVYKDGETRTVSDGVEEAEAAEDGFTAVTAPEPEPEAEAEEAEAEQPAPRKRR